MATMLLSRFLGLIRSRLLFHYFPTDTADIFFAAIQLPDLIFQLTIVGALSVAFIPIFTEHLEKNGKEEAFNMARAVLNSSLLIFIGLAILIFIFASPLTSMVFPGFSEDKQAEVVTLTRIILFGQVLLVFGSFFIGVLQSFQRFIIPALAAVFYNTGIIIGILFLSEPFGIIGPAVGIVIGAMLHMLIQIPLVYSMGFKFKFPPKFRHPGVTEILHLMGWRSVGLATEQVNEKVSISLSSLLASGSLTVLNVTQQLQAVPIGLFGVSLAQAALPVLSLERARGRIEEFKTTLLTTMHQILFLTLPATAILIVLRIPSVRLAFGAQKFDWEATVLSGMTLAFLAIGLSAQSVNLLFIRGFYALKDTKTPVLISFLVVLTNISLALIFIKVLQLPVWSIGLANALTSILSGLLLFWTLHFKIGKFDLRAVFVPFGKMLMASIIMGVALYIPIKILDQVIFDTTKTVNLIALTGLASAFALSIYVFLVWFMSVRELNTFIELGKKVWTKLSGLPANMKSEEMIHETE